MPVNCIPRLENIRNNIQEKAQQQSSPMNAHNDLVQLNPKEMFQDPIFSHVNIDTVSSLVNNRGQKEKEEENYVKSVTIDGWKRKLEDILPLLSKNFLHLKILDIGSCFLEEQHVKIINKIPTLETLRVNIESLSHLTSLTKLAFVKKVNFCTLKESLEGDVKEIPETFKTWFSMQARSALSCSINADSDYYNAFAKCGLPGLGEQARYQNPLDLSSLLINSALDEESLLLPPEGRITKESPATRFLSFNVSTEEHGMSAKYTPSEERGEINWIIPFFEGTPFKFSGFTNRYATIVKHND